MNSRKTWMTASLLLITTVIIGGLSVSAHIAKASAATCSSRGQIYQVVFQNNHASPENTYANRCDRIQFVNRDAVTRSIAFGPHEKHIAYSGILERVISKNESFTITLTSAGLYPFHDHFHDEVAGYFSVTK